MFTGYSKRRKNMSYISTVRENRTNSSLTDDDRIEGRNNHIDCLSVF